MLPLLNITLAVTVIQIKYPECKVTGVWIKRDIKTKLLWGKKFIISVINAMGRQHGGGSEESLGP